MRAMSRAPVVSPFISRPTGLDYFLVLLGCSLSLFLHAISHPEPVARAQVPAWVAGELLPLLPTLLALPQGIILFWPVFYALQKLRGRRESLGAGEWLLGIAWLGTVLLTAWVLWLHWGGKPGFVDDLTYPPQSLWTIIVVPTLALIALVVGLIGLVGRWKQPWTHTFGLVLLIWPVLPLAGLLMWAEPGWRWTP